MPTSPNSKVNNQENPRWIIKREDPLYGHYVVQQLAYFVVRLIDRTPITPNFVTALSFLTGLTGAVLFALGQRHYFIWGILFINLALILDCVDGQLCRRRGTGSNFGAWLDYHTDKLKDGAVLLGWTIGAYKLASAHSAEIVSSFPQTSLAILYFTVAFLAIFFQFLRNITALNRDINTLQKTGHKDEPRTFYDTSANSGQFIRSLKHSLLFKYADRILLFTIFGLLGLYFQAIIVYAALAIFYATLSAFLNYREGWRADQVKQPQ